MNNYNCTQLCKIYLKEKFFYLMLSTKCVYKSYLICMYKEDFALNNLQ